MPNKPAIVSPSSHTFFRSNSTPFSGKKFSTGRRHVTSYFRAQYDVRDRHVPPAAFAGGQRQATERGKLDIQTWLRRHGRQTAVMRRERGGQRRVHQGGQGLS